MYLSPEWPNLALKSCFMAQNTLKFEDFFLKSQKNFKGKSLALGIFFWPPPNLKILPTSLNIKFKQLNLNIGQVILFGVCKKEGQIEGN